MPLTNVRSLNSFDKDRIAATVAAIQRGWRAEFLRDIMRRAVSDTAFSLAGGGDVYRRQEDFHTEYFPEATSEQIALSDGMMRA